MFIQDKHISWKNDQVIINLNMQLQLHLRVPYKWLETLVPIIGEGYRFTFVLRSLVRHLGRFSDLNTLAEESDCQENLVIMMLLAMDSGRKAQKCPKCKMYFAFLTFSGNKAIIFKHCQETVLFKQLYTI